MRRHATVDEIALGSNDVLLGSVYVSELANVISYDPTTQTCSCQPLISDVRRDPSTGEPYAEEWPVMFNIKVMWPRGGGAAMAFGLNAGDTVNLIAYDFDPSVLTSPTNKTTMPADTRKLRGHSWRAIPEDFFGLPSIEGQMAAAGAFLGMIGDFAQISFAPGMITVGTTTEAGSAPAGKLPPGSGSGLGKVGQIIHTTNGLQLGNRPGGSETAFITADSFQVGPSPTKAVAIAQMIDLFIATVMGWTPVPNDGGAALKTARTAAGGSPTTTTAAKALTAQPK